LKSKLADIEGKYMNKMILPVLLTAYFVYSLCSGYISVEMTKPSKEMEHKAMKTGNELNRRF
jgi:hypothetical protein